MLYYFLCWKVSEYEVLFENSINKIYIYLSVKSAFASDTNWRVLTFTNVTKTCTVKKQQKNIFYELCNIPSWRIDVYTRLPKIMQLISFERIR